jgi:hypothetical protein
MKKDFVCDRCGGTIFNLYMDGFWVRYCKICGKYFSVSEADEHKVDSLPSDVEKVIINGATVVVYLRDKSKGNANCAYMDVFDPYVGFVLAYYKAKNNKNFALKKVLKSCVDSAQRKGYKQAILKNYDDSKSTTKKLMNLALPKSR